MTNSHLKYLSTSVAVLIGTCGTAIADVSAQDVWDSWKSYGENVGQKFTVGGELFTGNTLTVDDLVIAMESPEGSSTGTIEQVKFLELGDGTVEITMSSDFPFSMTLEDPDGKTVVFNVLMQQTGLVMIASGDPGAISYAYDADEFSVVLDDLSAAEDDVEGRLRATITDMSGTYLLTEGEELSTNSDFVAARLDAIMSMSDPSGDGQFNLNYTWNDITGTSQSVFPKGSNLQDLAFLFGGDVSAKGNLSSGAMQFGVDVASNEGPFKIYGTTASNTLFFEVADGSILYGGNSIDTNYEISGAMIPLPQVALQIAEAAFELGMPLVPSDDEKDFSFVTKLVNLSVDDGIWGMIDPGQILPRDPATLILDIAGSMKWLVDITDPDAMENIDDTIPVELNTVTINDVTLEIAGASIDGTGSFIFDNSDLTTFNGLPAPTGSVDININGADGLMGKLVEMGLLPQEQVMGAQMMMGIFARPVGDDARTSNIEVKGDGSVFANGQQIK